MVVFSAQDWWVHSHAHADFQLSIHLQHRVPVLLVNSMGLRRPSFTKAAGRARIFRKLRSHGFRVHDELFQARYDLYNGDLIEGGRGEILLRV